MSRVCGQCGHDNPADARYCERCAAPLANLCPACGFENPPGFKFCGNCGAHLASAQLGRAPADQLRRLQSLMPAQLMEKMLHQAEHLRGERRMVTVLFADLSGFTSISERLDPEDVYQLMDEVLRAFVEEIYRYEGTVDKFTGDGVMAIFGAPVAHEDDPERAVRAAIGMQNALDRMNRTIAGRYHVELKCRIGLNSGEVVVGGLGSDLRLDYTVMGDAVNVAARLQQAAEPGEILVSEDVFRATEPLFAYALVGDLRLKGKAEPVRAYRLLGERAQQGRRRGIRGLEAPLIGRQREFAQLKEALEGWITAREGGFILLTGEAGIGKSRLTSELLAGLAGRDVEIIRAGALSHTAGIGWWLTRELLRGYFGLGEGEGGSAMYHRVAGRLEELMGPAAGSALPYILNLLSPEAVPESYAPRIVHLTPAELQQQTLLALRELWTHAAQRRPLLFILDDVHWMDRPSLDVLLFLMGLVPNVPLIFYAISRADEGYAAREISAQAQERIPERFLSLHLGPLPPAEVERLLDELLDAPALPAEWRQIIVSRVEGNPFFLEEFVRMMMDRRLLVQDAAGRWKAEGDTAGLEAVPRTLRGLILARVDTLEERARHVLQCASVIGRSFSQRLLAEVVEAPAELSRDLHLLGQRGLIFPEADAAEERFTFSHALTQEAVYDTLLKKRRQALHRAVGQAIERLYADRLAEQVELLAHHFYLGEEPKRAFHYAILAGQQASARYANHEARAYYQRAWELADAAGATPAQRVAVLVGMGDAEGFLGAYEAARQAYQQAHALAGSPAAGLTPAGQAGILRRMARVEERQGSYPQASSLLHAALELLDSSTSQDAEQERARVYSDLGWVAFRQGLADEAWKWMMRALAILEPSDNWQDLAAVYNRMAGVSYQLGDWERAAEYARKGLELRERIGYTYGLSMSYNNLSVIYMAGGDWDRGILYAEKSLALKQQIGDVEGVGISFNNLGMAYKDRGDLDRARQYLLQALDIARKIRNANLLASALANLAHVYLLEGRWADGVSYGEEALRVAEESGSIEQQVEAHCLLAEGWLSAGDPERAEQHVEQARHLAEGSGTCYMQALAARAEGKLALWRGDAARALDSLERSAAGFADLGNRLEQYRARNCLGQALVELGRREEGRRLWEEALQVFEELGAERDADETRRLLEETGNPAEKDCGKVVFR
jgi:class 3 adenylate cyclase/tetratricopeptide (TPR) repeat protein